MMVEDPFRARTVGSKREKAITDAVLATDDLHHCDRCDEVETQLLAKRPRVRADCPKYVAEAIAPCPFLTCPYHYASDVCVNGSAKIAVGFGLIRRNCALDFVALHPTGASLEEVGNELYITKERVRQIEEGAIAKLRTSGFVLEITS